MEAESFGWVVNLVLSSSSASNATAPDANLRLVLDLPTVVRFFRAYGLSCRHSG